MNSGVMKMGEPPEPAIIGGGLEEMTHESNQMMNPGMTGGQ